ncbi:hypothetical protein AMECASPLE_022232 [Ameca splendens]|uniref:Uncharacterized protein n=1 Tax=Ameca splendens TaxID=208324 RepID=A0ABV0XSQ1_9TELE
MVISYRDFSFSFKKFEIICTFCKQAVWETSSTYKHLTTDMNVCKICVCFFFLLQSPTREEETVAEDIGIHQLDRLVEQLTSKECEDLLLALSRPEEDIFQHTDRLSPENNQLDVKFRAKRDTSSAADQKSQCRTALTNWLLVFGQKIYYNRLSRALQHIGRMDIAVDWGHTLNNWTCC